MRITSGRMIDLAAASTARSQERVAEASSELTSGLRVERPSDDPSAWIAAERTRVHRELARGGAAAVTAGRERLDQTDGALATIGDVTSQIRALAVQGATATLDGGNRRELAATVRALAQSALGAANTRTPDGEYLLAGSSSLAIPFSSTGAYAGDAIARSVIGGPGGLLTAIGITGAVLTSAEGVDVFPVFDRVAAALEANDPDAVAGTLTDLQTAIEQIALARTRAGGAMTVLDTSADAFAQLEDRLTGTIAAAVETDVVGAASELAKSTQALEAARAVSSHVIAIVDPNR